MLEKVQARLDSNAGAMGVRRETAEHLLRYDRVPDGCNALPDAEGSARCRPRWRSNVLAYNIKRVIAIVGVGALLEAMTI